MNRKFSLILFFTAILVCRMGFSQTVNQDQGAMDGDEIQFENEAQAKVFQKTQEQTPESAIVAPQVINECDNLALLENEYKNIDQQARSSEKSTQEVYKDYVGSFNDMTQGLFAIAQAKREEVDRINEAEKSLKESLETFNQDKNQKNSKEVQDQYMNLTVKLYSSAVDAQKTIDQLKSSLIQVENARAHYETFKQAPADLDQRKLDLEGKIISLKIRCQKT